MPELNPNDFPKQARDEQGNPGTGPWIVRKRPRMEAPMPAPSPYEERVRRESRRLVRLYGSKKNI